MLSRTFYSEPRRKQIAVCVVVDYETWDHDQRKYQVVRFLPPGWGWTMNPDWYFPHLPEYSLLSESRSWSITWTAYSR